MVARRCLHIHMQLRSAQMGSMISSVICRLRYLERCRRSDRWTRSRLTARGRNERRFQATMAGSAAQTNDWAALPQKKSVLYIDTATRCMPMPITLLCPRTPSPSCPARTYRRPSPAWWRAAAAIDNNRKRHTVHMMTMTTTKTARCFGMKTGLNATRTSTHLLVLHDIARKARYLLVVALVDLFGNLHSSVKGYEVTERHERIEEARDRNIGIRNTKRASIRYRNSIMRIRSAAPPARSAACRATPAQRHPQTC